MVVKRKKQQLQSAAASGGGGEGEGGVVQRRPQTQLSSAESQPPATAVLHLNGFTHLVLCNNVYPGIINSIMKSL